MRDIAYQKLKRDAAVFVERVITQVYGQRADPKIIDTVSKRVADSLAPAVLNKSR